jgi:tetratricopeptide (TPR) repeat protein
VRYYQQGEKRKALECYEKAVQIAPDHPVYQKNLADFYLVEEGRIKDALKLYVKVLEANPEDVECMLATGFVCVKMNNLDEARSFYERALEIEPWNADARQALTQLDQLIADATKSVNTYHAAG